MMTPLRNLLVQNVFEQPLLQATFHLPGAEGDDAVLRRFLADHSHQPIDTYAVDLALEKLSEGKSAKFTVLTRITNPLAFDKVMAEFDTENFYLMDELKPYSGKVSQGWLFTPNGEYPFRFNRLIQTYVCRAKVPEAFVAAL